MKTPLKIKLLYALISIVSFIICVLIVKLFNENLLIRGFVGDIVVIILMFFGVKAFYSFKSPNLVIAVLLLSYFIELIQYFQLIDAVGLGQYRLIRLVFGAVFDPKDMLAYTIGAGIAFFIDITINRWLQFRAGS